MTSSWSHVKKERKVNDGQNMGSDEHVSMCLIFMEAKGLRIVKVFEVVILHSWSHARSKGRGGNDEPECQKDVLSQRGGPRFMSREIPHSLTILTMLP